MDNEVELPPARLKRIEGRIERARIRHIAGQHDLGAEACSQGLDPLLEGISLEGEGKLGTRLGTGLRNSPGNRAIIRNAHDEAARARQ